MKAKFEKGQKVYYASTNVNRIYNHNGPDCVLCMVIERTVDSCGLKRATFEDDGNDFVFGKSISMHYANCYFATSEEAFEYLRNFKYGTAEYEVYPQVMSDKNRDWLEVSRNWKANK